MVFLSRFVHVFVWFFCLILLKFASTFCEKCYRYLETLAHPNGSKPLYPVSDVIAKFPLTPFLTTFSRVAVTVFINLLLDFKRLCCAIFYLLAALVLSVSVILGVTS